MNQPNDDLPHVLLQLQSVEEVGVATVANKDGKKNTFVKVVLRGTVSNEKLWEDVQEKLRPGMKIYSAEDFKGMMLETLRQEHLALEKKAAHLERELDRALTENRHMKAGLSVLGKQLEE